MSAKVSILLFSVHVHALTAVEAIRLSVYEAQERTGMNPELASQEYDYDTDSDIDDDGADTENEDQPPTPSAGPAGRGRSLSTSSPSSDASFDLDVLSVGSVAEIVIIDIDSVINKLRQR